MSRRTQRSYSGGSRPMLKSAKASNVRLRSGSTGNRPNGGKEENDDDEDAIQFSAAPVPLAAVVDPGDIKIVETNPEGQSSIADEVIMEEEADERGGWGNKLVRRKKHLPITCRCAQS